jgi:5'-3' exonuclease
MYGLDADLIMLGMVTHEQHFTLLRERQRFQRGKFAPRSARGKGGGGGADGGDGRTTRADDDDFVFLELELLRQLLSGTMRPNVGADALGFEWEEERAVDDFVFMCMLVGNDFIPGLPHLSVEDGALNKMLRTYTDLLPSLGGYLTDKDQLHFERFERFVRALSRNEQAHFEMKAGNVARRAGDNQPKLNHKRKYYLEKLGMHPRDTEGLRRLVTSYLEGLCWCLHYYHKGCRSWSWYYPDFYAPLASDLTDLDGYTVELEMGTPFPPIAQLLAVLPPQSSQLVPEPMRELMLSPTSPVIDAYPLDFVLDANGKRNEWEAIALLPFIDEARLLGAVESMAPRLTAAETARNINGDEELYRPADYRPTADELPLPADGELESLKVAELKQLLSVRGANTRGRKAELVSRLREVVATEERA